MMHQVPFFLVFYMNRPRIEPRSPAPLANTVTIMPISNIVQINFVKYLSFYSLFDSTIFIDNKRPLFLFSVFITMLLSIIKKNQTCFYFRPVVRT